MNFHQINPGDAKCILLTAAVSFAVGVVLTFSLMTIMSADDGGGKVSQVRYERDMFLAVDCKTEVHRKGHVEAEDDAMRAASHSKVCDEMRRIAESAVEKHHPKTFE